MQNFEHFEHVDATEEWKQGWIGWFCRLRGIFSSITLGSVGSVLAFLYAHWVFGAIVIAATAFLLITIFCARHFLIRRIEVDDDIHALFHRIRDDAERIIAEESAELRKYSLGSFHKDVANGIAGIFRKVVGDKSACCAIRLAENTHEGRAYVTRGRSDNLSPSRQGNTKPLPVDVGIASALTQKGQKGVWLIRILRT